MSACAHDSGSFDESILLTLHSKEFSAKGYDLQVFVGSDFTREVVPERLKNDFKTPYEWDWESRKKPPNACFLDNSAANGSISAIQTTGLATLKRKANRLYGRLQKTDSFFVQLDVRLADEGAVVGTVEAHSKSVVRQCNKTLTECRKIDDPPARMFGTYRVIDTNRACFDAIDAAFSEAGLVE